MELNEYLKAPDEQKYKDLTQALTGPRDQLVGISTIVTSRLEDKTREIFVERHLTVHEAVCWGTCNLPIVLSEHDVAVANRDYESGRLVIIVCEQCAQQMFPNRAVDVWVENPETPPGEQAHLDQQAAELRNVPLREYLFE